VTFVTRPVAPTIGQLPAEKKVLDDAAHKMGFVPEYKLLLFYLRSRAYKLLNDDLGSVDARNDHNRGRLHAYAEIYKLLSNGKDLFDGGTAP
jgi:hypothetical protein